MTNIDLISIRNLLSVFPCTGLPIEKIKKVLYLHNDINEKSETYEKLREKIFLSYDIKSDKDFAESPHIENVSNEIKEFDKQEITLPEPFLTEQEILNSVQNIQGITPKGILLLKEVLQVK